MMKSKVKDILEQFKANTKMTEIYETKLGAVIMGVWGRDVGTKVLRLKLVVVCPDGESSPTLEFQKSKLTSKKALSCLADIDGVPMNEMESIYKAIVGAGENLEKVEYGPGIGSLKQGFKEG